MQKAELTWKNTDLQSIAKKAGDNYVYILLDRVNKCEQNYPDCPELMQTVHRARGAFDELQKHDLNPDYIPQLRELFAKYSV